MRVFKVADGTSWIARLQDPREDASGGGNAGWETILFEGGAESEMQRLVYRPAGWFGAASVLDLIKALEEGVPVRLRWGG
jgi:hypothetical protein